MKRMADQKSGRTKIREKSRSDLQAIKAERQRAERALQKAHAELEHLIEERTAELLRANAKLKQEVAERRRAEEELKRTKEYLENVINNSVDAIGIVDRHGRFLLWNRRAEEIYGYAFHELAGTTAFELYAEPEELEKMLATLRREGVVREYEILMKKRDGRVVPMDISISLLKDENGRTIGSVCVARDLSERKKAEMELKRAREELERRSQDLERQVRKRTREINSIIKHTPAIVYLKDKDAFYKMVNPRYEELFGVKNKEILGKSDYDIFPLEVAERFRARDLEILRERRPWQGEETIPQEDGLHTYLSVKFPLFDEQGEVSGLCGISTDITELKKAQEQMRRFSGSILASQEKERAAIARELHDELGQVLTALRMDAVWLLDRVKERDPKAAERASAMCQLIDNTIDEVRALATRLRPGVLDDLGLIEALEWYTSEFKRRTGIACTFKHRNVPRVENLIATAAYRIAQEAMTNVARHSFASQMHVTLQVKDGVLMLTVVDNGCGFDVRKLADSDCLGLAGMRERASLVGGSLEVHSQPGQGTRVCFKLPFSETRRVLQ
uniref:PAS domain S-box protein n=1 Tax=Desulfobacca acetoxidans TaxID=60893 RepID=A0A7C3SKE8_9BACT